MKPVAIMTCSVLLPMSVILGGCAAKAAVWTEKFTTQQVKMPTSCEGWEKIELKTRTRYYLMREDQRLLVDVDAHNLRGRNLGCWE